MHLPESPMMICLSFSFSLFFYANNWKCCVCSAKKSMRTAIWCWCCQEDENDSTRASKIVSFIVTSSTPSCPHSPSCILYASNALALSHVQTSAQESRGAIDIAPCSNKRIPSRTASTVRMRYICRLSTSNGVARADCLWKEQ